MRLLMAAVPILASCASGTAQESLEYVGCYKDAATRAMVGLHTIDQHLNNLGHCADTCVGYQYLGLQNGNECFCGNEYDTHGSADESDCDKECTGDRTTMCGGAWRSSVYNITGESEGLGFCVSDQLAGLTSTARIALICSIDEYDETDEYEGLDATTCSAGELSEMCEMCGADRFQHGECNMQCQCLDPGGVGAGGVVAILLGGMCAVTVAIVFCCEACKNSPGCDARNCGDGTKSPKELCVAICGILCLMMCVPAIVVVAVW